MSGNTPAELIERSRDNAADMAAHGFPIYARALTEAADQLTVLTAAARKALNYIENTESEWGITLDSGDALRAALTGEQG
jgi:hypothetical protein